MKWDKGYRQIWLHGIKEEVTHSEQELQVRLWQSSLDPGGPGWRPGRWGRSGTRRRWRPGSGRSSRSTRRRCCPRPRRSKSVDVTEAAGADEWRCWIRKSPTFRWWSTRRTEPGSRCSPDTGTTPTGRPGQSSPRWSWLLPEELEL